MARVKQITEKNEISAEHEEIFDRTIVGQREI